MVLWRRMRRATSDGVLLRVHRGQQRWWRRPWRRTPALAPAPGPVRTALTQGPGGALTTFPGPSSTPVAVAAHAIRFGRASADVPVEWVAVARSRVRKVPALLMNVFLLAFAVDAAGSMYLREAMGVKLLDAYRANLVPPSQSVLTDATGGRVGTRAAAEAV
ncbi:MAG: hypothetical protein RL199_1298, partial [Pseudomonadota bacterium]